MTFEEVLREMCAEEENELIKYLPEGIAMAKQIEANRLAIQELRREYLRHVHTTSGMSRMTDPPA